MYNIIILKDISEVTASITGTMINLYPVFLKSINTFIDVPYHVVTNNPKSP